MQKKRILLLGFLALASCVGAVCVSRAQGQNDAAKPVLLAADANFPPTSAAQTTDTLKKLVWAIIGVVGIGALAVWASKKWLPSIVTARGRNIKVIESIQLAPHRSVHIVEVGSQKFLIGASNESVRMLADVTLALEPQIHERSNEVLAK
jgi:flagellar biogenesis protein FliO